MPGRPVVIVGEMYDPTLSVGGGPIFGGGGGGGSPPGIWPSPGHPAHPIAPGGSPPFWGGAPLPPLGIWGGAPLPPLGIWGGGGTGPGIWPGPGGGLGTWGGAPIGPFPPQPGHGLPGQPPSIWPGPGGPSQGPGFPTPPIYFPPVIEVPPGIVDGKPEHPIYIPVYPAHPIVIPPEEVGGTPEHPIVLPPLGIWGGPIIPPGAIDPGPPPKPSHPIYLPVYPAHPIVLPPEGGGGEPPNIPPPDEGHMYIVVAIPGVGYKVAQIPIPPGYNPPPGGSVPTPQRRRGE
jgi:hypothetical protein